MKTLSIVLHTSTEEVSAPSEVVPTQISPLQVRHLYHKKPASKIR